MVTRKEAGAVKDHCVSEYSNKPPYHEYVTGIGISLVGLYDKSVPLAERQNHCVIVNLKRPLPEGLKIAEKHDNVRIFTKVVGEIKPS